MWRQQTLFGLIGFLITSVSLFDCTGFGQEPQFQEIAQRRRSVLLAKDGECKLRDGHVLSGQIRESLIEGRFLVWNRKSSGDVTDMFVPLQAFNESDQNLIQTKHFQKRNYVRYQYLPPLLFHPSLKGVKYPKPYDRLDGAVAIENGKVFCWARDKLYRVDESAIPAEYLKELKIAFNDFGSGHWLNISDWLPRAIAGKVLAETPDSFVFESTPDKGMNNLFDFPIGTRFRLPKRTMGQILEREMRACLGRYARLEESVKIPDAELGQLPVLCRVMKSITAQWGLCQSPTASRQSNIQTHSSDLKASIPIHQLSCADHLEFELAAIDRETSLGPLDRNDAAYMVLADTAFERRHWTLIGGRATISARLVGAITNGFAFDFSGEYVFIEASQLNPIDRRVARIATSSKTLDWLDLEKLESLRTKRVLAKYSSIGTVVELGPSFEVHGVIDSHSNAFSAGKQELINGIHWEHFLVTGDNDSLRSRLEGLADQDRRSAEAKIAWYRENLKPAQELVADLPELKTLPVKPVERRWRFGSDRTGLIAKLVGRYGDDWVFESQVDDQPVNFLVGMEELSVEDEAIANAAIGRFEQKNWAEVLPTADNGQYYRLWLDPRNKGLLSPIPGVVVEVSSRRAEFLNVQGASFTDYDVGREKGIGEEVQRRYQLAMDQGRVRLEQRLSKLPLWSFRNSDQNVRARLVGQSGDDAIFADDQDRRFLVSTVCLNDPGQRSVSQADSMVAVSEAAKLPRLLIGRERLYGPGFIERVGHRTDGYLKFKHVFSVYTANAEGRTKSNRNGMSELPLSSLTMRQSKLIIAESIRRELSLEDDRSIDEELASPIDRADVISKLPELDVDIRQKIESFLWPDGRGKMRSLDTVRWQQSKLQVPEDAILLACNHDATFGLIKNVSSEFQWCQFSSGKTIPAPAVDLDGISHGPWVDGNRAQLWYVKDGRLFISNKEGDREYQVNQSQAPIIAAAISGDHQTIFLFHQDTICVRLNLKSGQQTTWRSGTREFKTDEKIKLAASQNGDGIALFYGNVFQGQRFDQKEQVPSQANFLLMEPSESSQIKAGKRFSVLYTSDSNRASLIWHERGAAPLTVSLPVMPDRIDIVDLGFGEVLQVIGNSSEPVYRNAGYRFVAWIQPHKRTFLYRPQVIEGTPIERQGAQAVWVAGKSSIVIEQTDHGYVRSRRNEGAAISVDLYLSSLARELVDQMDIGQIAATVSFLDHPDCRAQGEYSGDLVNQFFDKVTANVLDFRPHLGGDHVQRSLRVAARFADRFPSSDIAKCILANVYDSYAWDARGTGFAGSVSEHQWTVFRKYVAKAEGICAPLLNRPQPNSQVFRMALELARTNGKPLEEIVQLASRIRQSPYRADASLHHLVAVYLMPRWNGAPGMLESYMEKVAQTIGGEEGDAVYATVAQELSSMGGPNGPASLGFNWDLERLKSGTRASIRSRQNLDVLSHTLVVLANRGDINSLIELTRLGAERAMLAPSVSSSTLTGSAQAIPSGGQGSNTSDGI
ncbi:hypothetical protein LOC67_02935 [Stieleria sp. JC731]|uniref:hypothetical protein n=1 Tax=Pirellulaceae TaxID=2691357 RepID=UPI001E619B17|nr:hypothetical protein [Stieleria sp. JC731]MCC9599501.1 hypothetical protein [Stieleria sp. JC731]